MEARRTSTSIGSRVGILPEVLPDFTGSLGDRVTRGLSESSTIAQLGGNLREIRDTWGVTKEAMERIVPESLLERGLGAEEDPASRPLDADMRVAHDAVTTSSRKAQRELGKLVNQGRRATHTASLEQLPETARPPGSGDPLGGGRDHSLHQGLLEQPTRGSSHCIPSGEVNTRSVSYLPQSS